MGITAEPLHEGTRRPAHARQQGPDASPGTLGTLLTGTAAGSAPRSPAPRSWPARPACGSGCSRRDRSRRATRVTWSCPSASASARPGASRTAGRADGGLGWTPPPSPVAEEATMSYKTPQETSAAAVVAGTRKANLTWDRALVGGFLGGAYIAFGSMVAIAVSSGPRPGALGHPADAVHRRGLLPRPDPRRRRRRGAAHRQHGAAADRAAPPQDHPEPARRQLRPGADRQPAGLAVRRLLPRLQDRRHRGVRRGGRVRRAGAHPGRRHRARQGLSPRATARSSCAPSAATGWSASRSGWPTAPRTSPARSSRSSSRSWPSSRWASTTSWRTCSSCRSATSSAPPGWAGATSSTTCIAFLGNPVGAGVFVAGLYWFLHLRGTPEVDDADRGRPGPAPTARAPRRAAASAGATT